MVNFSKFCDSYPFIEHKNHTIGFIKNGKLKLLKNNTLFNIDHHDLFFSKKNLKIDKKIAIILPFPTLSQLSPFGIKIFNSKEISFTTGEIDNIDMLENHLIDLLKIYEVISTKKIYSISIIYSIPKILMIKNDYRYLSEIIWLYFWFYKKGKDRFINSLDRYSFNLIINGSHFNSHYGVDFSKEIISSRLDGGFSKKIFDSFDIKEVDFRSNFPAVIYKNSLESYTMKGFIQGAIESVIRKDKVIDSPPLKLWDILDQKFLINYIAKFEEYQYFSPKNG